MREEGDVYARVRERKGSVYARVCKVVACERLVACGWVSGVSGGDGDGDGGVVCVINGFGNHVAANECRAK